MENQKKIFTFGLIEWGQNVALLKYIKENDDLITPKQFIIFNDTILNIYDCLN